MQYPVVDHALASRLELAEGLLCARFIEARWRLHPASNAGWMEAAGAIATYDGAESPMTQTFGLGLAAKPSPEELHRIEDFYTQRAAPVQHEICPLAGMPVVSMLHQRGYAPIEMSTVLYRTLPAPAATHTNSIAVRLVAHEDRETWVRTAAAGWQEYPELAHMLVDLMQVVTAREGEVSFLAELHGTPIAAAALSIQNQVAILSGASTLPEHRRQGAQRALLEARLAYAASVGCELAMMTAAEPGSASQRNAERQGFRIAYTRTKWRLG
ncbi:MAG: GNAT family N-acetyltransferase [Bryobacterales bacterium]|nr:GNAT family N-acetyltransferase [Bryobacterales bacterium]